MYFSNISFSSLSLITLKERTPLYTFTSNKQKSKISFQNCKFAKFSEAAFYSNSYIYSFIVKKTSFQRFLHSAIALNNEEYKELIFYSTPLVKGSYVTIISCDFYRCSAPIYYNDYLEGGAILLRGCISDISKCVFCQNKVFQNGAAVRVSSSARTNIDHCLFAEIIANQWGGGLSLYFVFHFSLALLLKNRV